MKLNKLLSLFVILSLVYIACQNEPNASADAEKNDKEVGADNTSLTANDLHKSTAILYPAKIATDSSNGQNNAKNTSVGFGGEEEIAEMIQIFKSSRIRDRVIQEFDLMRHYDIDTSHKNKLTLLTNEYAKKVSFKRTQNGSVVIEVLDHDKDTSVLIANFIADIYDDIKNEMIKEKSMKTFDSSKENYIALENEIKTLQDSIQKLNKMGVVSKPGRASLNQALENAQSAKEQDYYSELIKVNNKYGSTLDALTELRENKVEMFTQLKTAYEQAELDANSGLTHKFILERAK